MKKLIFFLPLCFVTSLQAVEPISLDLNSPKVVESEVSQTHSPVVIEVGIDFWMMPRDAHRVMQDPVITQAVKMLIAEPESYLELHYPDGEMGELWGQELQAWLVALGIVSDRIELQISLTPIESIGLMVVNPTVLEDTFISLDLPIDVINPEPAESTKREAGLDAGSAMPVVDEPTSEKPNF